MTKQSKYPAPQADDEGWIKHDGEPMPCDPLQAIEVKQKFGLAMVIHAEEADWRSTFFYRLLCPAAERDTLAAKLAEVERERDEARAIAEQLSETVREINAVLEEMPEAFRQSAENVERSIATARDEALEEVLTFLRAMQHTETAKMVERKFKKGGTNV